MRSSKPNRIILNLPEISRLAQHRPIAYRVGDATIELSLQADLTPRLVIGAMLDLLQNGKVADRPGPHPPDPPEAREFLEASRRHHGK